MISVVRRGSEVILKVDVYPLGYVFDFSYNTNQEWAAIALYQILRKALNDRVQSIRKEEYLEGLKDARKKKSERKDWFATRLE
ncbi:hypothetical protein Rctr41k_07 [Virus Rctr41k]|nr:hypothetical protein Rctr41k_07 [Virus Rctr41k]